MPYKTTEGLLILKPTYTGVFSKPTIGISQTGVLIMEKKPLKIKKRYPWIFEEGKQYYSMGIKYVHTIEASGLYLIIQNIEDQEDNKFNKKLTKHSINGYFKNYALFIKFSDYNTWTKEFEETLFSFYKKIILKWTEKLSIPITEYYGRNSYGKSFNPYNFRLGSDIEKMIFGGFPDYQSLKAADKFYEIRNRIKKKKLDKQSDGSLTLSLLFIKNKIIKYEDFVQQFEKSEFPNFEILDKALKFRVDNYQDYLHVLNRYNTNDFQEAFTIYKKGFPDFKTYQEGKKLGISDLKNMTKRGFASLGSYYEALSKGCRHINAVKFVESMGSGSLSEAFQKYAEKCDANLSPELSKEHRWSFYSLERFFKPPDINPFVLDEKDLSNASIFSLAKNGVYWLDLSTTKHRYTLANKLSWLNSKDIKSYFNFLKKLFWITLILDYLQYFNHTGRIIYREKPFREPKLQFLNNLHTTQQRLIPSSMSMILPYSLYFISNQITSPEIKRMQSFISKIQEEIPISTEKISEKTNIEYNRCRNVIKHLIKEKQIDVVFHELEEVVIKKGYYCQICGNSHPQSRSRVVCKECGRFVCQVSFKEMLDVGKGNCPMCNGMLIDFDTKEKFVNEGQTSSKQFFETDEEKTPLRKGVSSDPREKKFKKNSE